MIVGIIKTFLMVFGAFSLCLLVCFIFCVWKLRRGSEVGVIDLEDIE